MSGTILWQIGAWCAIRCKGIGRREREYPLPLPLPFEIWRAAASLLVWLAGSCSGGCELSSLGMGSLDDNIVPGGGIAVVGPAEVEALAAMFLSMSKVDCCLLCERSGLSSVRTGSCVFVRRCRYVKATDDA